jgi:hypothetical protein
MPAALPSLGAGVGTTTMLFTASRTSSTVVSRQTLKAALSITRGLRRA